MDSLITDLCPLAKYLKLSHCGLCFKHTPFLKKTMVQTIKCRLKYTLVSLITVLSSLQALFSVNPTWRGAWRRRKCQFSSIPFLCYDQHRDFSKPTNAYHYICMQKTIGGKRREFGVVGPITDLQMLKGLSPCDFFGFPRLRVRFCENLRRIW